MREMAAKGPSAHAEANNGWPLGKVFFLEFFGLLILSLIFTYLISGMDNRPFDELCRLGWWRLVPYVNYHSALFCSLPRSATVLTTIYFLLSLGFIAACHFLYRFGRIRDRVRQWPLRYKIASVGCFWIVFVDWLFGLEGARGSAEGLTSSGYLTYFFITLGISFSHVMTMHIRYRRQFSPPLA